MSIQAKLAMIAWLPIVFYLFTIYGPRKAVIVSFIGGLLFLPQRAGFPLPLIPDYEGMVATCYGIVLAIVIHDSQRLREFKPRWIDLPMLIWCICPIFSSLTNGLGFYDGINEAITQAVTWGLPYFLGRFYLNNLAAQRELALNIIKGGLLYVPLCLYEGRMSPQLHNILYGYYPHTSGIAQSYRLGGYRPMVFMEHGLMVGMWMMMVTLVAFWLWQAKTLSTIWHIPIERWVIVITLTFIWCRSTGAYGYLLYGLIILFSAKWLHSRLFLLLLIIGIIYYLYTSATGHFDSEGIISFVGKITNPERSQSLEFRFDNEALLADHARNKLLFGWGGWGRNRLYAENWHGIFEDLAVTDSLWIIAFGINGLLGLVSLITSLILPIISFCFVGYPVKTWFDPKVAPAAVLATTLLLFILDCLLNDMFNPVFPLISGGLSGLVIEERAKAKAETNNKDLTKNHRYKSRQSKLKLPQ
jgi:hypothetical protein